MHFFGLSQFLHAKPSLPIAEQKRNIESQGMKNEEFGNAHDIKDREKIFPEIATMAVTMNNKAAVEP
ncbi:unnamed protein product [Nippostrongylus brasiliensis]|uniref:Secreted protein n=1 Tax=Nippostrongylus brasiliensis TaxID=27835 RepID=A0A0N4Y120_NIPBR|nr:unnamed protein product [Nippostrongylus brasiliensis]